MAQENESNRKAEYRKRMAQENESNRKAAYRKRMDQENESNRKAAYRKRMAQDNESKRAMKEHRFQMRVGLKTNNSDQSNQSSNLMETPQKLQQSNPGTSISPGVI